MYSTKYMKKAEVLLILHKKDHIVDPELIE